MFPHAPYPFIHISNLVQYWTAIYSKLVEDEDIPFVMTGDA